MEPRRGTERRLAPIAKAASARAILALAAAALLLAAGCGGDSDDPGTAGAPGPAAEQGGTTGPTGASEPTQSSKQDTASKPTNQTSGSKPQGAKANQGAAVPLPTGDGRERGPTPAEEAQATVADMTLTSPALSASGTALPSRHTCDGEDTWPALQWGGTPAGSEELVLFAMNSRPVAEKLFFNWAVAGIDPGLAQIEEGRLPPGAVSGRNDHGHNGYSICPPKGSPETYIFALFALPRRLSPARGFDPARLRGEVLDLSGNVGLLAVGYGR